MKKGWFANNKNIWNGHVVIEINSSIFKPAAFLNFFGGAELLHTPESTIKDMYISDICRLFVMCPGFSKNLS